MVSSRVLHALGIRPWECNAQSCRRDQTGVPRVSWFIPQWFPAVDITVSMGRLPLYAAIRTPRLVPMDAKVWRMIGRSDIDGLRVLFRAGGASAHVINAYGWTVLRVSVLFQR